MENSWLNLSTPLSFKHCLESLGSTERHLFCFILFFCLSSSLGKDLDHSLAQKEQMEVFEQTMYV